jgi:hypothetical protein
MRAARRSNVGYRVIPALSNREAKDENVVPGRISSVMGSAAAPVEKKNQYVSQASGSTASAKSQRTYLFLISRISCPDPHTTKSNGNVAKTTATPATVLHHSHKLARGIVGLSIEVLLQNHTGRNGVCSPPRSPPGARTVQPCIRFGGSKGFVFVHYLESALDQRSAELFDFGPEARVFAALSSWSADYDAPYISLGRQLRYGRNASAGWLFNRHHGHRVLAFTVRHSDSQSPGAVIDSQNLTHAGILPRTRF